MKSINLVVAILLFTLMAVAVGLRVISHQPLTPAFLMLQGSLLLFGTSRAILFRSPNSTAVQPLGG